MRSVLFILLLLPGVAQAERRELGGRGFIVHAPNRAQGKRPLVIVLHGGLGNAAGIARTSGLSELADREGFVAVYPDGTGGRAGFMADRRTWNAGSCCGMAQRRNVDDVLFIREVIENIERDYSIDAARVYIVGHSNGGMMTYRLACELPDKIAAVVSVSGALAVDRCPEGKDVALLEIHGAQDQNVPLQGGRGRGPSGAAHRAAAEGLSIMAAPRRCGVPRGESSSGVERTVYSCERGAPVELTVLEDGEHRWPQQAAEEAWRFLKRFSKPSR